METSMYEDGNYVNYSRERVNNLDQMKRKLTLDLNRSPKKQRSVGGNFNPLLTSPDLKMLKLASPELEKFIIQQGTGLTTATATTTTTSTNSGFYFPKAATVEQEEFAKGFEESLEQLRYQDSANSLAPTVVTDHDPITISSSNLEYTQLESHPNVQTSIHHEVPITEDHSMQFIQVKEEPQTVPSVCGSPPPVSPIDLESQERIKLERKRLRNRIAASKCRRRKLERINKLEGKVNILKNENSDLQTMVNRLKEQVCSLKQEVMEHVTSGCEIPFVTNQ